MPAAVATWLDHAGRREAAPMTARLDMTGQLKLGVWLPFIATQWIDLDRGFVWAARVGRGVRISGSDSCVDGRAAMKWKLGGVVPLVRNADEDVDRSAAWRFAGEGLAWLPGEHASRSWHVLPRTGAAYAEIDTPGGERARVVLDLDESGALRSVWGPRWGRLGRNDVSYHTFEVHFRDEATFDGITVPTRVAAGWRGTPDRPGPLTFFRATVRAVRFDVPAEVSAALDRAAADRRR